MFVLVAATLIGIGVWVPAAAGDAAPAISPEALATVFPGADGAGPFEGSPPAAPVYTDDHLVGYVFSTYGTVATVGYSGKPIDILAGVDLDGVLTGALLIRHNEPILVIGVSHEDLARYVGSFAGIDLGARTQKGETPARGSSLPDAISGATVSSAVILDGIIRAGRTIARSRGLIAGGDGGARLDRETYAPATWADLMDGGSIVHRVITQGEVAEALKGGNADGAGNTPDALFVDLYVGLLSPPRIGQNLLGKAAFNRLGAGAGLDDNMIFIAANGLYSFKGTAYRRSGAFDRIQIVQGENTIHLEAAGYENVEELQLDGAPEFREIGVFVVPASTGFDPLKPWRLDLLVHRGAGGDEAAGAIFSIDYTLPERYRVQTGVPGEAADAGPGSESGEQVSGPPLWQEIWFDRWFDVVLIIVVLLVLSAILVFQDTLARDPRLHRRLRLAFLAVTLFGIGWYAGGQLSVVNVLTFSHALMSDFQWEFFLLDPIIFLLWSYVAVAMLFWGRGVFCGWLCPFGALQELLNGGARKLRVPQARVPFALHERLWPIKYVIFLGLFAVSLSSTNLAFFGAEVEPFKTAISLKFVRAWPFVVYALALLAAGLFINRFFCRYLCPLGAALAIPARLRMFEWLKRRPQCGRECAICEHQCPVQAIHPIGAINPNECIHCLQCQVLYFDNTVCPPLVAERKRRERREALAAGHRVSMEKHQND